MKKYLFLIGVTISLIAITNPVLALTVQVDPDNANGTTIFATLTEAAQFIRDNNDVGVPDVINVMVDTLVENANPSGVFYDWYDDITINGDGNGNGVWCTVIVEELPAIDTGERAFFRFISDSTDAWDANIMVRNFIMIPKFKGAGQVHGSPSGPEVRHPISWALGGNADTAGTVTVDNFIMTGSLAGDVPADPFVNDRANATLWYRGYHVGSKSNLYSATQAITYAYLQNSIIAYTSVQPILWYGDATDMTFGPGLVLTYTNTQNAIQIINTSWDNVLRIKGTQDNRNLFYNIGTTTGHRMLSSECAGNTRTYFDEISYTDFVKCTARQLLRLTDPVELIDNCLFTETVGAGSGNVEFLAGSGSNRKISNTTFFNTGPNDNARHISGGMYGFTINFENVIFAASANEVQTANSTADIAINLDSVVNINHCLFPEFGLHRLKEPYDDVFPPSPPRDAAYFGPFQPDSLWNITGNNYNVDPQFLSDNVDDYPLPASMAAWQAQKITLANSNYLRPSNTVLRNAGTLGTSLYGVHTYSSPLAPTPTPGPLSGLDSWSDYR